MPTPPEPPRVLRRVLALLAAVAMALVASLLTAPAADAHDALQSASPERDRTVTTSPTEVALTFNQAPLSGLQSGIVVQVTGPSGAEVTTGDLRITDRTLSRSVAITENGTHTVTWRTVSADGHPIDGSYSFAYARPLPTPTATTPASDPATTSPSPAPRPATPNLVASPSEPATPVGLLVAIGAFILLALVAAVWIIVSSSRRRARQAAGK